MKDGYTSSIKRQRIFRTVVCVIFCILALGPFLLLIMNATRSSEAIKSGISLAELVRRPELDYWKVQKIDEKHPDLPYDVCEQVNIDIKYEGYIRRQKQQVEQFRKLEGKKIPEDIRYEEVGSLRKEAIQKLEIYRPLSIGQASRISGVSPADISVLLVYLEQKRRQKVEK